MKNRELLIHPEKVELENLSTTELLSPTRLIDLQNRIGRATLNVHTVE